MLKNNYYKVNPKNSNPHLIYIEKKKVVYVKVHSILLPFNITFLLDIIKFQLITVSHISCLMTRDFTNQSKTIYIYIYIYIYK